MKLRVLGEGAEAQARSRGRSVPSQPSANDETVAIGRETVCELFDAARRPPQTIRGHPVVSTAPLVVVEASHERRASIAASSRGQRSSASDSLARRGVDRFAWKAQIAAKMSDSQSQSQSVTVT
jgi:hypothetical protein